MKHTNEKVLMSVIAGMTALQGFSSTMMNISATTSHVDYVKLMMLVMQLQSKIIKQLMMQL